MLKVFKRKMGYEGSKVNATTREAFAVTVWLSGHSAAWEEGGGSTTSSYCGQHGAVFSGVIEKMYSGIPADFLPLGCRGLSPYYPSHPNDRDKSMNGALKATELKVVLDRYWGAGEL